MSVTTMLGTILVELRKLNKNLENRVTSVTVNIHADSGVDIDTVVEGIKKSLKSSR